MCHLRRVAGIIAACILEAGGGRWPTTLDEWQRAANRFGATIVFRDRRLVPSPYLRHGVIYIPAPCDANLLPRWLAHEVAEAALLWDGEPPYILPCPIDGQERHRISRLVEELPIYPRLVRQPLPPRSSE